MANSEITTQLISIFNHQFFGITIRTLANAMLFLAGMLVVAAAVINYVDGQEVLTLIGITLGGLLMLKAFNASFGGYANDG